jgi:hypothetical protein
MGGGAAPEPSRERPHRPLDGSRSGTTSERAAYGSWALGASGKARRLPRPPPTRGRRGERLSGRGGIGCLAGAPQPARDHAAGDD